jgi:hypothetical protein
MADTWQADFAAPPPFAHLRPWRRQLGDAGWPSLDDLNRLAARQGLLNARGLPIRFQVQTQRCGQRQYESAILSSGQVPTRPDNWHDLLNALTWLALPRTKAALNGVQCQSLGPDGTPRGPTSDAATLFDESGLVLAGPDSGLAAALRGRQWHEACVTRRQEWAALTVIAVGHAVLEKLLDPWAGITAKCAFIPLPANPDLATVDQALARLWEAGKIHQPADLFPLPVLGVPGWWSANEAAGFYDNESVFRPLSRARRDQACTDTGRALQASPGAAGTS